MNFEFLVRFIPIILLQLFLLAAPVGSALAQSVAGLQKSAEEVDVSLESPASKEAVRELVSRMSDDSVRKLLIERLDAVAESETELDDDGGFGIIQDGFLNYWTNAVDATLHIPMIPDVFSKIHVGISQGLSAGGFSELLLVILFALFAGLCAERLVTFFFRKRKQQLIEAVSTELLGILKILYTRLSFDVLGVLAFAAASAIVINNFYAQQTIENQIASILPAALFGGWLGYVISRFFFAPKRPELRICKTTDAKALQITISFSILAFFIVGMHNLFYLFARIGVENYGSQNFEYMSPLGFLMNMSMYIAAAGVIWYNREGLTEILMENKKRVCMAIGEEAPENLSWFAINWPKIAMTLILVKYLLVEIVVNSSDIGIYSTSAVYTTFVVIFLWPGVDANISLCVARGIKPADDESDGSGRARRSMQQGLLRVGRVLVVGIVLYALTALWGVNVLDLAHSGLGARAAGSLIEFLFVLLLAYMSWELVSIFVGYWLAMEGGNPDDGAAEAGGEIGGVGLSRVATLLPIIRKTSQFLIIVVSIVMVLNNWGVNIGPILAGAGVIGLAIGFGAQTLVKDIVSGLFFLADDAFRVGEYIDVGGTMGNVEKISLRSLRLRHHRGLVHTVPYGEIPKLTNFSRDWVIMKLRFRVPFETDINKVKKLFKQIGKDLLSDPVLGEDFLQPFKSQGVAEVDDNGIIVRGKFMAKPGKQFMIRKEVYVRVQKAFDAAGIPFARKQVMVHIPGLEKAEELGPDEVRAIGAAASESVEDTLEPKKT